MNLGYFFLVKVDLRGRSFAFKVLVKKQLFHFVAEKFNLRQGFYKAFELF